MKTILLPSVALFLLCLLVTSCENTQSSLQKNVKAEKIFRKSDHYQLVLSPPEKKNRELYPWETNSLNEYPKITKEFFRCKGSSLNPARIAVENNTSVRYYDCGGGEKHSLPLRDGREFVYPILLDLLNYLQEKTGSRVVITCGHRCPEHNAYADSSPANQYSKHMIGAEVTFYLQGMEERPDEVIEWIKQYYSKNEKYKDKKEFEFQRYEKDDVTTSTQPWLNKEIFIKLYKKKEGRTIDNRHPYPYLSIQVRHDPDLQERVNYSWEKAHKNYLRW